MATIGVSVIVLDGKRMLLQKRRDFRIWALPGGRVELGETLEAAAIRETFEETGLNVALARKVGTYWKPQKNDTVTVFEARVISGEIVRVSEETVDVRWFDRDHLPWLLGTHRRYIGDARANLADPVQDTLQFSFTEMTLHRIARLVYRFKKQRA